MDIWSLLGIPTTSIGVIWMLIRIGVWYWYNHTVEGREVVARDVIVRDTSFFGLLLFPLSLIVLGVS